MVMITGDLMYLLWLGVCLLATVATVIVVGLLVVLIRVLARSSV